MINMDQEQKNLNNISPKKMNLGLIIGIIIAMVVIGFGIIFGSKLFLSNDNSNNSNKNRLGASTLVAGSEFNARIKTLVAGYSQKHADYDGIITHMYILSNGNLPGNYTLEELEELENVDVSDSQDGSIKAYVEYDEDNIYAKVYVYSENQIYANEDSMYMFFEFGGIKINNLNQLDTSKVTDMSGMFYQCSNLPELDLSKFDTSKVTEMNSMFEGCDELIRLDLSNFDTSNVTDMSEMFNDCSNLKKITVSDKWEIDESTDTYRMFTDCGTDHVTIK